MNEKVNFFIIATPIGNLGDISFRAVEILKLAEIILCEDTRVTKNLLDFYQISSNLESYHQHSSPAKVKQLLDKIKKCQNVALVTDAGTPGISDPGNLLVQSLIKDGEVNIIPIPGPAALIAALSVSGFPTDKFLFLGFPPHKNKRKKYFSEVAGSDHTVVFYESCHRIKKTLNELSECLSEKSEVMVGRELTKKFETTYRGKIKDILKQNISEKGEFVIVIHN